MNNLQRGGIVLAACASAAFLVAPGATAALDNTPPTLTSPIKGHFVAGTQLTLNSISDPGSGEYFFDVPQSFAWSATDDQAGPIFYTVNEVPAGDDPSTILGPETGTTNLTVGSTDYDDQEGGGSFHIANWTIEADDSAGNGVIRNVWGDNLVVRQDDGYSESSGTRADLSGFTYTGSWSTAHCACFAEGTTHDTTQAGASAATTVTVGADQGVRSFALVMEKAANRGKADVFVDGVFRKTIDTHAAATKHRVVVWQMTLGQGTHTVKVVNDATPGHARIDLDAAVVN